MRYKGSKEIVADDIVNIIQQNRYNGQYIVDLFCGSCSVIIRCNGNRIANDNHPYLMAMWRLLQMGKSSFFPTMIPKDLYVAWRDYYNRTKHDIININRLPEAKFHRYAYCGWIGFMASFNGKFYDGGYSGHAVKKGKKIVDMISSQVESALEIGNQLNGIRLVNQPYQNVQIPDKSIIYCDPPQNDFDYDGFYEYCHQMKNAGHTVYISQYDMSDTFTCIWEDNKKHNPIFYTKQQEKLWIPK